MQKRKGVSLVVLVITIIVMIILASAVMLSLNNTNIFDKAQDAVLQTNLKELNTLAQTIWAEGYLKGSDTATIRANIVSAIGEDATTKYYVRVTEKGASVLELFPEEWKENVATVTAERVPIPKGFVVSPYEGENTKDDGLVIYELDSDETEILSTEGHQTSLEERNQYVWVPVDDFSEFRRQKFDSINRNIMENDIGVSGNKNYWEVILDATNMPDVAKNAAKSDYMTVETASGSVTNTLAEVQAMYASVKEYGGFYIARYEAGIATAREEQGTEEDILYGLENVHSKMGKIPYTYIPWTWNDAMDEDTNGAVSVARSLYPDSVSNTTGVVSTLTYGVQWDTTVTWLEKYGKDVDGNLITSVEVSTAYGNYRDHIIAEGDLNPNAQYWYWANSDTYENVTYSDSNGESTQTKDDKTEWLLSTGALKAAKVNNIYDMAGNVSEHTMEGRSSDERIERGSTAFEDEEGFSDRYAIDPDDSDDYRGFRVSLYIKK